MAGWQAYVSYTYVVFFRKEYKGASILGWAMMACDGDGQKLRSLIENIAIIIIITLVIFRTTTLNATLHRLVISLTTLLARICWLTWLLSSSWRNNWRSIASQSPGMFVEYEYLLSMNIVSWYVLGGKFQPPASFSATSQRGSTSLPGFSLWEWTWLCWTG